MKALFCFPAIKSKTKVYPLIITNIQEPVILEDISNGTPTMIRHINMQPKRQSTVFTFTRENCVQD
jgi:hypothetical protein